MTVIFFGSLTAISFLTAWLSLTIYCHLPDTWLCDFDESPGPVHCSQNRCPRRRLSILFMSAAVLSMLMLKITEMPFSFSVSVLQRTDGAEEGAVSVFLIRELLFLLLTSMILLPAALSDIDFFIIPDQLCALAAAEALLRGFFQDTDRGLVSFSFEEDTSFILSVGEALPSPVLAAAGGLLCAFLMLLSCGSARLFSGKEGMGMGDVKLMTACGALVSSASDPADWAAASFSVFAAAIMFSAVWFSVLLLLGRASYGEVRPMAPWIVLSTLIVLSLF